MIDEGRYQSQSNGLEILKETKSMWIENIS